ncbi:heterogeneous nuclear ribonucleoprotein 1-like [Hibiscus syriacus]|uniref:heterogeneous nuclear ribonucleoprotein 1-like n=1 Tax=Hibiscus syriacus TaxID=106335 RepID=UPI0019234E6A|nr:heterogeneous nuclear ribonucleoprotein 1-like [Hibiscus syriacus]XP_039021927.1 heterogeneous nuclear ribonucleoprotein 1-like [Hibiscus syriacus]XP_039021928.1 heterogeneous nuclear ribonucleoprotein 1-like [Hibiscus syriacus]
MFENGKLFIGGIAWDTNEERLKEYFSSFGEVIEAVIMKDRTTRRARGFGFVVFADPAVVKRVIKEKHNIDGRMVEAKKAVPRDDQSIMSRSTSSIHGSPGPGSTRKIFVGGLASTVTESDFKKYFDQFGNITDVVLIHDHNTQRPRGFGFITYDSEESVDKALLKNFHELNGKMVEVKRAVPKELLPSPNHSHLCGYNYDVNRINNFLNGYNQGYGPSNVEGYGLGMDARFSPITSGRGGFPPFGSGDGMGMDIEPRLNQTFGNVANFSSSMSYGRGLNPYYLGDTNTFGRPIGYNGSSAGNTSFFSSVTQNLWGNCGLDYNTKVSCSGAYMGSGSGSLGGNYFGNSGINWGSAISSQCEGNHVSSNSVKFGYGSDDNCFGSGTTGHGRNNQTNLAPMSNGGYDRAFADQNYGGVSVYGDAIWRSSTSEPDVSGSFGYGLGGSTSDVLGKSSPSYVGGYSVNKRQANIGIAT